MKVRPASADPREFESRSFKALHEHLAGRSRQVRVLDLGPPMQSVVDYFGQFHARLRIVDLPRFARARDIELAADCHHLAAERFAFEELLSEPDGPYNLILAWNYFNYLNRDTIIRLMSRLNEFCARGTLLYFVTVVQAYMPDVPARMELTRDGRMRYDSDVTYMRNSPRYAPKVLESMMPSFEMQHMFLLQNGLQENVYVFRRRRAEPRLNVITDTSLVDFSTPVGASRARMPFLVTR